jgi:hypothetical protein
VRDRNFFRAQTNCFCARQCPPRFSSAPEGHRRRAPPSPRGHHAQHIRKRTATPTPGACRPGMRTHTAHAGETLVYISRFRRTAQGTSPSRSTMRNKQERTKFQPRTLTWPRKPGLHRSPGTRQHCAYTHAAGARGGWGRARPWRAAGHRRRARAVRARPTRSPQPARQRRQSCGAPGVVAGTRGPRTRPGLTPTPMPGSRAGGGPWRRRVVCVRVCGGGRKQTQYVCVDFLYCERGNDGGPPTLPPSFSATRPRPPRPPGGPPPEARPDPPPPPPRGPPRLPSTP